MGKSHINDDTHKKDGNIHIASSNNKPKVFGIGGALPPKRNLRNFVRWPRYVSIQRKKRIILERLKIPPTIAQFSHTINKSQMNILCNLLHKYQPDNTKDGSCVIKLGLNQITQLVEEKKAQLVVIAHDVDPIEIVCWLPTLCKKMGIPYLIVRSKARLGRYVHKKKVTALAISGVTHDRELVKLIEISNNMYISNQNKIIKTF